MSLLDQNSTTSSPTIFVEYLACLDKYVSMCFYLPEPNDFYGDTEIERIRELIISHGGTIIPQQECFSAQIEPPKI